MNKQTLSLGMASALVIPDREDLESDIFEQRDA